MSWEVKSGLNGQKSPYNFEKSAKTPFLVLLPLFSKMAGWELLKIASNVDISMPLHFTRSDLTAHFVETYFENSCGVRVHIMSVLPVV